MAQGQNLMGVVMPQFAYKKGHQLHHARRKIEELFVDHGLNMDCKRAIFV